MKRIAVFTLFACLMVIVSGCGSSTPEDSKTTYHTIDAKEAKEMMDNTDDIIVLDVRTKEEYEEGHIPNAKLLPLDSVKEDAEKELDDKSATILVYCRSGNRSAQATRILADLGYENLYDFGGINSWTYDIEK